MGLGRSFGEFFEARNHACSSQHGRARSLPLCSASSMARASARGGPSSGEALRLRSTGGSRGSRRRVARRGLSVIRADLWRCYALNSLALCDTARGREAHGSALASEIEAMERDPQRCPWQDGLPRLVPVFEPYRAPSRATTIPHQPFELVHATIPAFRYEVSEHVGSEDPRSAQSFGSVESPLGVGSSCARGSACPARPNGRGIRPVPLALRVPASTVETIEAARRTHAQGPSTRDGLASCRRRSRSTRAHGAGEPPCLRLSSMDFPDEPGEQGR